eukprot:COSAG05_NODE_5155_length_1250_cov_5.885317_1_plen_206_part_00
MRGQTPAPGRRGGHGDYDLSSLRDLTVQPFFTCRFGQEVLRHAGADLHPCCETMARASGALLLSLSPSLLLSNTNISTSTLPPPSSTPTPSPTPPAPCSVAFRKLGQTKPLGRVGALRGSVFVFITGNTFPSDQKIDMYTNVYCNVERGRSGAVSEIREGLRQRRRAVANPMEACSEWNPGRRGLVCPFCAPKSCMRYIGILLET